MAYLSATLWNDLQATEATNEKRFSELGVIDAVKASTRAVDFIPPSVKAEMMKMSSARLAKIPVLKDQTPTVVTTPGFQFIPLNRPESDQYSFTAVDVFSGFRHYPGINQNNTIDSAWEVNQVMRNVAYACGNTIESILLAQLELRKTQVLANTTQMSQGAGTFTFNTSTDTLEVNKAAQKATMFFETERLMESNELPGRYRIVTNRAGLAVQMSEALQYGAGNDHNLQARGFFPMDRIHETGNISASSDVFHGFMFRDGAIGVVENFPYDFRAGTELSNKKWSISDTEIPYTGMRANIYVDKEAVDATAMTTSLDSNLIMTHFEEMAVWFRFYVVYPYNSDLSTRANDVVKILGTTT
jgi:hypothetical protein